MDKQEEEKLLMDLGKRIRALRRYKDLTQQVLSDRTEMDKGSVSKIENGKVNVSYITLINIANTLGVSIDELLNKNIK